MFFCVVSNKLKEKWINSHKRILLDEKEKYKDLIRCDEDVLTCALFEAKAVKFLTARNNPDEIIEVNLYIG